MLFSKTSNLEKAITIAKVGFGVATHVAFFGACLSIIKHVKNEEEQKRLILQQLQTVVQTAAEK